MPYREPWIPPTPKPQKKKFPTKTILQVLLALLLVAGNCVAIGGLCWFLPTPFIAALLVLCFPVILVGIVAAIKSI